MKLGLILESPKDGTDHKVYGLVIERLCPDMSIEAVGFRNKRDMIAGCGVATKLLLESDMCDRVAIIWDLIPPWDDKPSCRCRDREKIIANLRNANVNFSKVKLICIEPELEGWIIVEKNALQAYRNERQPTHQRRFDPPKIYKTNRKCKPIIERYLGKYNDITEAKLIVEKITNFDRVARKHESFRRFKEFMEGW